MHHLRLALLLVTFAINISSLAEASMTEPKFVEVKVSSNHKKGTDFLMGHIYPVFHEYMEYLNELHEPHKVTLTYNFRIQTTEVTQAQWYSVMKENRGTFVRDNFKRTVRDPSFFSNHKVCPQSVLQVEKDIYICPNRPVENMLPDHVYDFLDALNAKNGLNCGDQRTLVGFKLAQRTSGCYRLPTEAEWEYAAKGKGATGEYFYGSTSKNWQDYYDDNGETYDVAAKKINPIGLYDIYGNVAELVQDNLIPYTNIHEINPIHMDSTKPKVTRGWASSDQASVWFPEVYYSSVYRDSYGSGATGLRLVQSM